MNNIPHILVIDDEKEICDLIEIYLTQESFQVFKAYDATRIIEDIKEHSIDLVILDIMMPGIDGFQALELLRKNSNIRVIFLSAKTTEDDKVEGLLKGADDYIGKPFSSNELVARVKSQLRRYTVLNSPLKEETSIINANDLKIDIKRKIVTINDMPINLTRIEYNILVLLATHPETVYSTEDIFETIWNEKPTNADNTIMVHIRKLREKVERQPRNPRHIKTVWGIGYKFTL